MKPDVLHELLMDTCLLLAAEVARDIMFSQPLTMTINCLTVTQHKRPSISCAENLAWCMLVHARQSSGLTVFWLRYEYGAEDPYMFSCDSSNLNQMHRGQNQKDCPSKTICIIHDCCRCQFVASSCDTHVGNIMPHA